MFYCHTPRKSVLHPDMCFPYPRISVGPERGMLHDEVATTHVPQRDHVWLAWGLNHGDNHTDLAWKWWMKNYTKMCVASNESMNSNQTGPENRMVSKLGELKEDSKCSQMRRHMTWDKMYWNNMSIYEITLFQYHSARSYHGLRFLCQPRRSCMAPVAAQLARDMTFPWIGWHRLKVFKQPGGLLRDWHSWKRAFSQKG